MTSGAVTTSDEGVRVSAPEEGGGTELSSSELGAGPATTDEYAALFRMALNSHDAGRARSAQTDGGLLGASDAGGCEAKAVYTIRQHPPTNVPKKGKALVGTALHHAWLPQMQLLNPDLLIEQDLLLTLPSGRQIPVHPDVIDPSEPSVTDLKTTDELNFRRKAGPDERHWWQVALYALAAQQAGLIDAMLPATLRLLYVDMTDADNVYVEQRPFSMDLIAAANEWFENVAYAVKHDEHGARTGQSYFCQSYCPFFDACKPPLVDAAGELTNLQLRQRAEVAYTARQERKTWEKIEREAVSELRGVSGRAGDIQVVSTWVNSGKGYWKTDLTEVR
jgi:hypothetical protein